MNHPRSRFFIPTVVVLAAGALAVPIFLGCDSKRPATSPGGATATGPVKGGEAAALADLDTKPDAEHCRTALQQLDNLDSAAQRPALSDSDRAEFVRFLRMTPAETAEIGQTTFSQTDAAYLEECLLVRTGVKSLRIDARPPLERARLGFEWACRLVYIDDRWTAPTNPWTTLQCGTGVAISRAYLILAVWQQLGLDGCLIGPPELETAPSATLPNPTDPTARPTYAPIRACAVKVGSDLYLFDPASGRPVAGPDGKGPLTLAQAKAQPEAAKGLAKPEEVKTWQPFLAPTLSGLGRRMEWLERFDPGNVGVKLFINLARQRTEFAKDLGGAAAGAWSPEGDPFSAGRVLAR
ncbi:MAG TPA: hypothetical protein VKD90_14780, partial [Gemmataceae bacterium]|nr:hypothetical protein [Gemmataceae bacterium]